MIDTKKPLWVQIASLSAPLILSMTGFVLMQFIDALFLSWYSADAIAAIMPSGMAVTLVTSFFQGTAGYTSTFVAHYVGARQRDRACNAVWQGIWFSLIAGVLIFFLGFVADPLFSWAGHQESVRVMEIRFFMILCWGAVFSIVASALTGYFSGQGKTTILLITSITGFIINAVLDYVLIFGKFGMPRMGITGAAIATVVAQASTMLFLLILFLKSKDFGIKPIKDCAFDKNLFMRLIRFGLPGGLRFGFEMLAWTVFVFFIGRIGIDELAATNIAFRINGFAFFPIIGLGQALAILVGQAQGRRDPRQTVKITYTGLLMAEIWMMIAALVFVIFPSWIYSLFMGQQNIQEFAHIALIGVNLLKFVAVYSLLDACNIVVVSSLQAAGDTRWTMVFALIANALFLIILYFVDSFHLGIWIEWTVATLFVMTTALAWVFRFNAGIWRSIKVIEHYEPEVLPL